MWRCTCSGAASRPAPWGSARLEPGWYKRAGVGGGGEQVEPHTLWPSALTHCGTDVSLGGPLATGDGLDATLQVLRKPPPSTVTDWPGPRPMDGTGETTLHLHRVETTAPSDRAHPRRVPIRTTGHPTNVFSRPNHHTVFVDRGEHNTRACESPSRVMDSRVGAWRRAPSSVVPCKTTARESVERPCGSKTPLISRLAHRPPPPSRAVLPPPRSARTDGPFGSDHYAPGFPPRGRIPVARLPLDRTPDPSLDRSLSPPPPRGSAPNAPSEVSSLAALPCICSKLIVF